MTEGFALEVIKALSCMDFSYEDKELEKLRLKALRLALEALTK